MIEEAALVTTKLGVIGVAVSLPDGPPGAAAILLKGEGPVRFGNRSNLARTARALADEGIAVLRLDYPGQGDSTLARGTPVQAVLEVLEWYRARIGRRDVVLLGGCFGGRLATTVASVDQEVAGLALVVPYPWSLAGWKRRRRLRMSLALRFGRRGIDRRFVRELRAVARDRAVWIAAGEHDDQGAALGTIARRVHGVTFEVVPDANLYGPGAADCAEETWSRTARAILAMARVPASA